MVVVEWAKLSQSLSLSLSLYHTTFFFLPLEEGGRGRTRFGEGGLDPHHVGKRPPGDLSIQWKSEDQTADDRSYNKKKVRSDGIMLQ